MDRIPTYILAGGQSKRFGSDKARALFRGVPMLGHVRALVEPLASTLTVVAARPGQYDDLGVRTIGDLRPGLGPLAGLETALADAWDHGQNRRILLVTCDLVLLNPDWIDQLLSRADERTKSTVLFANAAHRTRPYHPFPGLYHPSMRTSVSAALDAGTRALQDWLLASAPCALDQPPDWPDLASVNTRAHLARIEGSGAS